MTFCPVEDCDRPPHDGWTLCDQHAWLLERDLAEVPALQIELDTQLSRMVGRERGGPGRSAERPMPYDPVASERTTLLRDALRSWVRELEPAPGWQPPDSLPALAQWLLARVDDIVVHHAAGKAVDEIRYAVQKAWQCVDTRAERVFFGPCGCGAELSALIDARMVRCQECSAEHAPGALRDALTAKLDGHLVTGPEFVAYAVAHMGVPPAQGARLQDRIRQWKLRGAIVTAGHVPPGNGHGKPQPTYRFGDLAAKVADRRAAAG